MSLSFDLYLVVSGGEPELERALAAVRAAPPGRVAVQARWKDEPDAVIASRTARLVSAARPRGVPVLVSSRSDLASALGASGVHLPELGEPVMDARAALPPGALVGASCHDEHGVRTRAHEGANFVVLGPVGDVPGKGRALDDATFERIARTAPVPVFALGGISRSADVSRVLGLGAYGIAVQRAICASSTPAAALAALLTALDACRRR